MYLYSFSHYAGIDKIFLLKDAKIKAQTGDLIKKDSDFFLLLGDEISFPELYTTLYTGDTNFQTIQPNLLSKESIKLLHRMSYQRYSSYKKVIPLLLDEDIEKLIAKMTKPNKKDSNSDLQIGKILIQQQRDEQILIIFPDLWSINNIIKSNDKALNLSSLDTQSKKNTNRWKIKTGQERIIISTASEIFQDYQNLKHIYLIEPQKWYYASQQDPRYKVQQVAEKLAEIHGAQLHLIESENL